MDELIKYIKNKGYKITDVTETVDIHTYEFYVLAMNTKLNENTVIYFKRNILTNPLFESSGADETTNYYFLNKDNFLYVTIEDIFSQFLKLCINKFLEEEVQCGICYNMADPGKHCNQCAYTLCGSCILKLITQSKIILCPQCRKPLTLG
jgi:hypothetical protein